ncbi:MAG: Trp biosynthesis-associated membrane protein [Nocardioides sp.]|uniref:Trp biosynthesis-associated membrane protein n=1 Tax=Nocardioides sp. TaxID=35761 RepID=UPI0039E294C9
MVADHEPGAAARSSRRTFLPTALTGAVAAGVGVLAGSRPWLTAPSRAGSEVALVLGRGSQVPLAVSLGLVALAAWGVLLVTRGKVRRLAAVLGVLAAVGVLALTVRAWWSVREVVRDDLAGRGLDDVSVHPTWWYAVAVVAAGLSLAAFSLAWRWLPTWPEMGRRYDAPGVPADSAVLGDADSLDLWKALDEGRDPTEGS